MENLLLDVLVEVVGHDADKRTLPEIGDLVYRNHTVHLHIDRGGYVLTFCRTLPNRLESVLVVSPITYPESIFPTVFRITELSFSL